MEDKIRKTLRFDEQTQSELEFFLKNNPDFKTENAAIAHMVKTYNMHVTRNDRLFKENVKLNQQLEEIRDLLKNKKAIEKDLLSFMTDVKNDTGRQAFK